MSCVLFPWHFSAVLPIIAYEVKFPRQGRRGLWFPPARRCLLLTQLPQIIAQNPPSPGFQEETLKYNIVDEQIFHMHLKRTHNFLHRSSNFLTFIKGKVDHFEFI